MTNPIPKNVLGGPLRVCCMNPMTGFYRTGLCEVSVEDVGVHAVCIQVTEEFLIYSKSAGNDLSSPVPQFDFSGLKPGDKWCLCAARWQEAFDAGMAPFVVLSATSEAALEYCDLAALKSKAIDQKRVL